MLWPQKQIRLRLFYILHHKTNIVGLILEKYRDESSSLCYSGADNKQDYCSEFDLRKPLERHYLTGPRVDCFSIQDSKNLAALQDRCATFLAQFQRYCYTHMHACIHLGMNTHLWYQRVNLSSSSWFYENEERGRMIVEDEIWHIMSKSILMEMPNFY